MPPAADAAGTDSNGGLVQTRRENEILE
jgi:hypothetical protein